MDSAFETKTRERAYAIWLAEGMRDGDAERHWLCAEEILRHEAEVPAVAAKAAKPAAAKKGAGPARSKSVVASAQTVKTSNAKTSNAKAVKAETSPKAAAPRRAKASGAGTAEATA